MHHRRGDFRRRCEGLRIEVKQDLRPRPPARQHAQPAIGIILNRRHDALGHFLLEHQRQRFPEWRPGGGGDPVEQELGADIIGQVGDDLDRIAFTQCGRINRQRIGFEHLEAARIMRRDFGKGRKAAAVLLDGHHLACAIGEQRPGQATGAGADLDHGAGRKISGGAGNARGQVEVEQEILAERLLRVEAVRTDHLAQGRQAVDLAHSRFSGSARTAAMRNAAARLCGLALPVPAISKAVPWSGEVRTKGRPRVTFTVSSKAMVLTGIRT